MLKPGVTRAILMVHGHRCQYCGSPAKEADHIVPTNLGGSDDEGNLTASCRTCNASKGNRRINPELEKELLLSAWIYASDVRDVASRYRAASSTATVKELRAGFIKMSLTNTLRDK